MESKIEVKRSYCLSETLIFLLLCRALWNGPDYRSIAECLHSAKAKTPQTLKHRISALLGACWELAESWALLLGSPSWDLGNVYLLSGISEGWAGCSGSLAILLQWNKYLNTPKDSAEALPSYWFLELLKDWTVSAKGIIAPEKICCSKMPALPFWTLQRTHFLVGGISTVSGQQCTSVFLSSAFTRVAISVAEVSGSGTRL